MIGGKQQKGNYTLDARFNREDLVSRIKSIGSYRISISLFNMDAMDLAEDISAELPSKSLIFLILPTTTKGRSCNRNFYGHDDHAGNFEPCQTDCNPLACDLRQLRRNSEALHRRE